MGEFYKIRESLDLFSKALGKEKNMNSRASVEFFVEKKGRCFFHCNREGRRDDWGSGEVIL